MIYYSSEYYDIPTQSHSHFLFHLSICILNNNVRFDLFNSFYSLDQISKSPPCYLHANFEGILKIFPCLGLRLRYDFFGSPILIYNLFFK